MEDLIEQLQHLDEVDLLELLDITSEEIVVAFQKRIEKRRKYLEEKLSGERGYDDEEDSSE